MYIHQRKIHATRKGTPPQKTKINPMISFIHSCMQPASQLLVYDPSIHLTYFLPLFTHNYLISISNAKFSAYAASILSALMMMINHIIVSMYIHTYANQPSIHQQCFAYLLTYLLTYVFRTLFNSSQVRVWVLGFGFHEMDRIDRYENTLVYTIFFFFFFDGT